ncbi:MAG: SDR family NAD(P)-dependent oxidoreductase [Shewanella sp.]
MNSVNRDNLVNLISLKGKSALVTGAASGIGLAIATKFAEAGADLVLVNRSEKAIQKVANELAEKNGVKVDYILADLSTENGASHVVQEAYKKQSNISILVNNAGRFPTDPLFEITDDKWDELLNLNLRSKFILARDFGKEAVARKLKGTIVNMGSVSSTVAFGNSAHYVTSKHAIIGLTKSLARELGPHGIRSIAIAPGITETQGLFTMSDHDKVFAENLRQMTEKTPLRRNAKPEDIANVALFCVSPLADFVTGTSVLVDGGILAI